MKISPMPKSLKQPFSSPLVIILCIGITQLLCCCERTTIPALTTAAVTNITYNLAISGGNIIDEGGSEVTAYGVCWSTSINPTNDQSRTIDGMGKSTFVSVLTDLKENTIYYVRAYATNDAGIGYGNEVSFSTRKLSLPKTTATEISIVGTTYCIAGGTITDDGGGIDGFGICWNTLHEPEPSDFSGGLFQSGPNIYTSYVTGLNPKTTYFLRTYATNQAGISFSNEVSVSTLEGLIVFNPALDYGSLSDIDGNVYKTIKIGSQTWMAENLKTTRYTDGTPIPKPESLDEWDVVTETSKAYCYYNNNPDYLKYFGALYTWPAAMNGSLSSTAVPSGVRGVCPVDWHIPSPGEWNKLLDFLGGKETAGGKMKEAGYSHWLKMNEIVGNNSSGFTGLPGGHCDNGLFNEDAWIGMWWSSGEMTGTQDPVWAMSHAWYYALYPASNITEQGYYRKKILLSVRCVKD